MYVYKCILEYRHTLGIYCILVGYNNPLVLLEYIFSIFDPEHSIFFKLIWKIIPKYKGFQYLFSLVFSSQELTLEI